MDGDVRNKAITSEMARLQGTELYHGVTGQKRQSGLDGYREVVLGVITSLPKNLFSLTFDNHFSVLLHRNNPRYYWGLLCHGCQNALAGNSQSTYDYKTDNVESLIIARSFNDNSVSNVISLVLVIYSKYPF